MLIEPLSDDLIGEVIRLGQIQHSLAVAGADDAAERGRLTQLLTECKARIEQLNAERARRLPGVPVLRSPETRDQRTPGEPRRSPATRRPTLKLNFR